MWNNALDRALMKWGVLYEQIGLTQLLIVLLYLVCIWMCFVCGYSARQLKETSIGWFAAAALLVLLAIETVLHTSALFIFFMRDIAAHSGWYHDRRYSQSITLGIAVFVTMYTFAWLRHRYDAQWHLIGNVIIGLSILFVIGILRVISLHDIDEFMDQRYVGISLERWLEIAGLACVFYGTLCKLQTI